MKKSLFEYHIQQIYEHKQLFFSCVKSKLAQDFPSRISQMLFPTLFKILSVPIFSNFWASTPFCKLCLLYKLGYSQELIFV